MLENLRLSRMIELLEEACGEFPDVRTGKNSIYDLSDVGMSAFSVFFTQSPSFLAHQRDMKLRKGRSNAESLFHLREIPSDNQIRNLLDAVSPEYVAPVYRQVFVALEQAKVLEKRRSFADQLLVAIDGTEYFSSKSIHCANCSHRELTNGKTNYFHSVMTPVIVQPGNETVISLEPEFIVPQDGHEKQDCEIQAAKRWVEKWGDFYAKRGVTILGDDLFSRDPFCRALKNKGLHLILVCKPDSHPFLYQTVDFLATSGVLGSTVVRRWVGR